MKTAYFPDCSLDGTSREFGESVVAVVRALGADLHEIDDWNCCGATSYFSVREMESFAIAARNLSIAQKQGDDDLCVICNACYTTLAKTNRYMAESGS